MEPKRATDAKSNTLTCMRSAAQGRQTPVNRWNWMDQHAALVAGCRFSFFLLLLAVAHLHTGTPEEGTEDEMAPGKLPSYLTS